MSQCNIDQNDRINRGFIGLIIFVAALLGFGQLFFLIVGVVMMAQAYIGWCSIPYLIDQFKLLKSPPPTDDQDNN